MGNTRQLIRDTLGIPRRHLECYHCGIVQLMTSRYPVIDITLTFAGSKQMKRHFAILMIIIGAGTTLSASADDSFATRYAEEAVELLTSDLERIEKLQASAAISSSEVDQARSRLHEAKLTLLRLRGDTAGIEQILLEAISNESERHNRQQELAKRGYTGTTQLHTSELRVLIAHQRLANHTNDRNAEKETLRRALEIEKTRLETLTELASRGYASRSAVAEQKLRIAQLIASRKITLPNK